MPCRSLLASGPFPTIAYQQVCWGGGLIHYQRHGADCLQRTLLHRFRFRQRLSRSVRRPEHLRVGVLACTAFGLGVKPVRAEMYKLGLVQESCMPALVRTLEPQDHASAAALFTAIYPGRAREPETWCAEVPNKTAGRWVAITGTPEQIAGYGAFWRVHDYRFRLDLLVHPAQRCQGVGSRLLAVLIEQACAAGAATLQARARADAAASLHFLGHRGFTETMRMHWSALDLRHLRDAGLAPRTPLEFQRTTQGIVVSTLRDEEEHDPACWAKLADLYNDARQGWPDPDPGPPEPPLSAEAFRHSWAAIPFLPEACFIARHGAAYVGYSGIAVHPDTPEDAWPLGTAVRPAYRNQGIATLLKAHCLRFVCAHGFSVLHSGSGNPALLRINAKLGFRPTWTEVRLVRQLGEHPLEQMRMPHSPAA
jgi:mycothiol synthase